MKFSDCKRLLDDCWLNYIKIDDIKKEFDLKQWSQVDITVEDGWIEEERLCQTMDEKELLHAKRIAKLASELKNSAQGISLLWNPEHAVLVDGNHRLCAANFLYRSEGIDVTVKINLDYS